MPGMDELKELLKDLFEALVWLLAFFTLAVAPVPIWATKALLFSWLVAGFYRLYRKGRNDRVSED